MRSWLRCTKPAVKSPAVSFWAPARKPSAPRSASPCARAMSLPPSSATTPDAWPLANRARRHAHLPRLAARAHARTRWQHSPRPHPRGAAGHDFSHLGAMISPSAGVLLARRMRGQTGQRGRHLHRRRRHLHGLIPRGLESRGGRKPAPGRGRRRTINTPTPRRTPASSPAKISSTTPTAMASTGHSVDGTDLEACLEVVCETPSTAPAKATGRRWSSRACSACAATASTTTRRYVDPKLKGRPSVRDCLEAGREDASLERGWAAAKDLAAWRRNSA